MTLVLLLAVTLALAAANGANDNVKGAATLVGSGLLSVRQALRVATAATALGGLLSVLVAGGLLAAFGGDGLVPAALVGRSDFLLPVALGAAATVALASALRLPVSTTHALVGALLGTAAMAAPEQLMLAPALTKLVLPLLIVPVSAIVLALALLPLLRRLRRRAAAAAAACLCVQPPLAAGPGAAAPMQLGAADDPHCAAAMQRLLFKPLLALDRAHLLSACAVSFARGVNDTPKIAAFALASGAVGGLEASLLVVLAMAAGGLCAGQRVAGTMAFRITRMDPAEGLGGNLVAAGLILGASPLGLPVSTTHVTCGALFGVAASRRGGRFATIGAILTAWVGTLPLAAALAAGCHWLLIPLPSL